MGGHSLPGWGAAHSQGGGISHSQQDGGVTLSRIGGHPLPAGWGHSLPHIGMSLLSAFITMEDMVMVTGMASK